MFPGPFRDAPEWGSSCIHYSLFISLILFCFLSFDFVLFCFILLYFYLHQDILVPYFLYQHYGDIATLSQYYDSMLQYLGHLTSNAQNNIISYGLGDWCGIFLHKKRGRGRGRGGEEEKAEEGKEV